MFWYKGLWELIVFFIVLFLSLNIIRKGYIWQKLDDLFMGKYIYMKPRDVTVFLTRVPRAFKKDLWIKNTICIQDKFSIGGS